MKNWSKGAKVTFWVVVAILILAFLYQMKWLGNKKDIMETIKGDAARSIRCPNPGDVYGFDSESSTFKCHPYSNR